MVRHPILVAFFLWSAAHLMANGDLAHAAMFGSFAGFALFDMWIMNRRRQEMSEDAWREILMRMRAAPIHLSRAAVLRFGVTIAAVVALILLHPWPAGVGVLWRFLQ